MAIWGVVQTFLKGRFKKQAKAKENYERIHAGADKRNNRKKA